MKLLAQQAFDRNNTYCRCTHHCACRLSTAAHSTVQQSGRTAVEMDREHRIARLPQSRQHEHSKRESSQRHRSAATSVLSPRPRLLAFCISCQQALERVVRADRASTCALLRSRHPGHSAAQPELHLNHKLQSRVSVSSVCATGCHAGCEADLETLIAAQDLGFPVTDAFINSAAGAGHADVLELLYFDQGFQLPARVSSSAAGNAQIDVLRWLQRSGIAFDEQTALLAASRGYIQTLQYLLNEHTEFALDESLCRAAAISGRLSTLQFLREAGCPWADTITNDAAECSRLEVMQWLHEQGVKVSVTTMQRAAIRGNLEMVQYLCAEGCPWNKSQGCPIDATMCYVDATLGKIVILECLREALYTPDDALMQMLLTITGAFGQLATAQYLRQQGAEWPPVLNLEGQNWTGEVLAWARAEGCTSPVI
eukprot:4029-Heterococcus_DN1.PRE.2